MGLKFFGYKKWTDSREDLNKEKGARYWLKGLEMLVLFGGSGAN